ncbi:MAG: hypothetical protein LBV61_08290, partial [Burkholderiaceae bacterium]|nr:hypothetical protein [Burkholderiaceae bacterium]
LHLPASASAHAVMNKFEQGRHPDGRCARLHALEPLKASLIEFHDNSSSKPLLSINGVGF